MLGLKMVDFNGTIDSHFLDDSCFQNKIFIGDVDLTDFYSEVDNLNSSVSKSEVQRIENQLTISFSIYYSSCCN